MASSQDYFDAVIRHQIGLARFSAGETKRLLKLLDAASADLEVKLSKLLRKYEVSEGVYAINRARRELQEVMAARHAVLERIKGEHISVSTEQAYLDADFERISMGDALPVKIDFATITTTSLAAIVLSKPFQGALLEEWWDRLSNADRQRLESAIMLGMTEGLGIDAIVRNIVGSKFEPGAAYRTRSDVAAVVRTAVTHVSNSAREMVWEANSDIIEVLMWNSTLDGRTSPVCRARDHHYAPVRPGDKVPEPRLSPPGARPPAHMGCRSLMVAIFNIDGVLQAIGERPFVRDTRTRQLREKDFRKEARDALGANATKSEVNAKIRELKSTWAEENIGRVEANVSYQDWFARQPKLFQDDVLGKTKADLFRKGGLPMDKFVNESGRELTLDQLRRRHPLAWKKAFA